MFVKLRMTANPFTVRPDNTLPEAMELMATHRIRHLPVVEDGRVVGVLSQGDIDAAGPSRATTFSAGEVNYLLHKLKVAKVMTRDPLVIAPDALLEEAALAMRDNKIEMLPVVEGGRLVGIITESAILDSFIDILGFRDRGTRLWIEATDSPGVLSNLTGIMGRHGANIIHLAVFRGEGLDRTIVVVGVNTARTDDLEADLAANGFQVVHLLRNP